MPEGENNEPTTTEQVTEEGIEEESLEDIAERIDRDNQLILERLAAIESTLAELSSGFSSHAERFNGIDARFDGFNGGGSPPAPADHGPEPTHWYFRKVGGKSF
jgi:hypothetical protein